MIVKNIPTLKTTSNKFLRGFDLPVSAGIEAEFNFSTASDTVNTKVYLNNNRITLHSSVKMAWLYLNLAASTTNINVYVQYSDASSDSYNSRGAYGYGANGNINICIPLIGRGVTDDITIKVFSDSSATVYYNDFWSHAYVTALYE